ncbi:MAG: hypothetical protein RI988_2262, partial [Pseudomonadota bacterium]
MTARLAAAAATAVLALLLAGCAGLPGWPGRDGTEAPGAVPAPAGTAGATGATDVAGASTAAEAVQLDIDAPPALKALLERHLDLARLAQLSRAESVGDSELARLVDAAPMQVRELLTTEGYFEPQVRVARVPAARPGAAERVQLRVEPGPQTRIGRVTLEIDGPLAAAAAAGDAPAIKVLEEWRQAWRLRTGQAFRNSDWSDAKSSALSFLRSAGYAAAGWSGTALEVDASTDLARIFVVADSGPLFRRGPIVIEGLTWQDRPTVENLLAIAEGQPVTEVRLLDAQDRLQKSGLFERIA